MRVSGGNSRSFENFGSSLRRTLPSSLLEDARGTPVPKLLSCNSIEGESVCPIRWDAWGNPMRSQRWRCFWRRMIPVSSRVLNCSLTAVDGKSDREPLTEAVWLAGSQAGFFRRSATVFKISCESTSSDTARASDIAPTSALKVKIALDLAARACPCLAATRQSTQGHS